MNPLPETGLNHFKHPQDLKHPARALDVLTGDGAPIADLYVPVRIAGDLALLKGIAKELLEEEERRPGEVFDHAFIRAHTHGYDALLADLRGESWELVVEQSGVSRADIRRVAEMVMAHERLIVAWAMGLTQQPQAVAAIQSIVNLLLLRGSIGKPGAGALPVRGHSNVQGDRTVGDLGADVGALPGRAGPGVRLRAAAQARLRHGGDDPGHARGQGQGVLRHGRQRARPPAPTPSTPPRPSAAAG